MKTAIAIGAAALAAAYGAGTLRAHHSSSMFDISTPIWVEGTVVDYEAVNPHATMVLEERSADGEVRRWTVEGPHLGRIRRMGAQPAPGDVIEVCGFALRGRLSQRRPSADPYGMSERFVHGHALLMPDGHWELFGAYGLLAECIRSSDEPRDSWVEFLDNSDPSVRDLWCGQRRAAQRRASSDPTAYSTELVDEINALMANPCR